MLARGDRAPSFPRRNQAGGTGAAHSPPGSAPRSPNAVCWRQHGPRHGAWRTHRASRRRPARRLHKAPPWHVPCSASTSYAGGETPPRPPAPRRPGFARSRTGDVPATPATGTRRAPGSSRTEAPVDAPAALSEHGRGSSSVGAPACHSRTPPRPGGPTCALAPRPGWRAGTAARPGPALRQVAAPPHAIHRRIASTMAKGGAARTSRRHSPWAAHDGPTAGDTPAGRSCHLGCHHGRRQRPACHPRPPRSQHRSASPPRREAAAARAAGV